MDKEDAVYCTHTMDYSSDMKDKEILPFATTQTDLEGISLSDVS